MCLSGTVDNYWAMSEENDHLELAYQIAKDLGEPQNSFNGLVNLLRSTPAQKLNPFSGLNQTYGRLEITFLPVVESAYFFIRISSILPLFCPTHFKHRLILDRKRCKTPIFGGIAEESV